MIKATKTYIPDRRDESAIGPGTRIVNYGDDAKNIVTKVELCKFLNDEVSKLNNLLLEKNKRLDELLSKFSINTNGDNLKPNYEITFNSYINQKATDDVADLIMKNFIKEYGFDFSEVNKTIEDLVETIRCIEMSANNQTYCEVDLLQMTENKEPVEC